MHSPGLKANEAGAVAAFIEEVLLGFRPAEAIVDFIESSRTAFAERP
jgi:hypothetical protein